MQLPGFLPRTSHKSKKGKRKVLYIVYCEDFVARILTAAPIGAGSMGRLSGQSNLTSTFPYPSIRPREACVTLSACPGVSYSSTHWPTLLLLKSWRTR